MFVIDINRSRWMFNYLIILHSVLLITMINVLPNVWAITLMAMTLLLSFIYYCRQYYWLKNPRALANVECNITAKWKLTYFDGSSQKDLVLRSCLVTPQWVILRFVGSSYWRGGSVIIKADTVDVELFRRLRVYLKDPKTFQQ